MKQLYFKTSADWRKWLRNNNDKETELWLVFYKKGTGKPTMKYEEAVEEALCYGWIDSLIKKIDEEKYVRKFNPRKEKSFWSESNKDRVAKLIKNKLMTKIGLARVDAAKENGMWEKSDPKPDFDLNTPEEFFAALYKNKKAKSNYDNLAPTYQKPYNIWISSAKRKETRIRRIKESIKLLEQDKKLGLK